MCGKRAHGSEESGYEGACKVSSFSDFTLLVDGGNAFNEILACIDGAKRSVKINMFIWREDEIGKRLASALLGAAERGVRVEISVDRYGILLENVEECRKSFFHRKLTLIEKIKVWALKLIYPQKGAPRRVKDEYCELARTLLSHPLITVEADVFKADHSKYYIIDDEILILGGINVEDKEIVGDLQGRAYQDYMAKLVGKAYVDAFNAYMVGGNRQNGDYYFAANTKNPYRFDMKSAYLELIESAKEYLYITMAYFSPLKEFEEAILRAYRRGVKVTITIPERANFQNDTNRLTVRSLMKQSNNGICVYLSPKMLHTKLMASESLLSFGSTNITKKAFSQLSELNLFVRNIPCPFVDGLLGSVQENIALSKQITDYKQLKYRRYFALLESTVV